MGAEYAEYILVSIVKQNQVTLTVFFDKEK